MIRTTTWRRCSRPRHRLYYIRPSRWNSSSSNYSNTDPSSSNSNTDPSSSNSNTDPSSAPPIVQIKNGTFYRDYPSSLAENTNTSNHPIFPHLTFSVPSNTGSIQQRWAVVSPASLSRTTFLKVLNNEYITLPPTARTYPFLSSTHIKHEQSRRPEKAVRYIGFDAERGGAGSNAQGSYLAARYEARKEETDWSLKQYLEGDTDLNPLETAIDRVDRHLLQQVVDDLRLQDLLSRPVSNLSNGQTRRVKIAKTLLSKPELLLLDAPFMGLDPRSANLLSRLLETMSRNNAPRIVLSLRPDDLIPNWIDHIVYIDDKMDILAQGSNSSVYSKICDTMNETGGKRFGPHADILGKMGLQVKVHDREVVTAVENSSTPRPKQEQPLSRDGFPQIDPARTPGEPVIEFEGVRVSYGPSDSPKKTTVLGNWQQPSQTTPGLHWSIHRGQRWGIFGPNGSGKTTLLSLITSDHPQAYSLPMKHFGRSRLPEPGQPGISVFELQKRMGHSSPEVHAFFPKHLSLRRVLESAWADAPLAKPKLDQHNNQMVDICLGWFAPELLSPGSKEYYSEDNNDNDIKKKILEVAETLRFRDLSFSQQRLALFLRAIVAQPDIVILDEAFSGIDEDIRDKCLLFLSHGEKKTLRQRRTSSSSNNGSSGETTLEPPAGSKVVAQQQQEGKKAIVVFEGLTQHQALLSISHSKEDVPGCIRNWICLPEGATGENDAEENSPARWGILDGPLELHPQAWHEIWDTKSSS